MSISKLHPQLARLRMWPVIARHREYSPDGNSYTEEDSRKREPQVLWALSLAELYRRLGRWAPEPCHAHTLKHVACKARSWSPVIGPRCGGWPA